MISLLVYLLYPIATADQTDNLCCIYYAHAMLMLLAKFEIDWWFNFSTNKKLSKNGIPKKPDDVIMMSSNVHEWKSKPRPIVWFNVSLTDH